MSEKNRPGSPSLAGRSRGGLIGRDRTKKQETGVIFSGRRPILRPSTGRGGVRHGHHGRKNLSFPIISLLHSSPPGAPISSRLRRAGKATPGDRFLIARPPTESAPNEPLAFCLRRAALHCVQSGFRGQSAMGSARLLSSFASQGQPSSFVSAIRRPRLSSSTRRSICVCWPSALL